MWLLFFNNIADILLIMLFWRHIIWCINSWTFCIYICCQFSDFPSKTSRICPINPKNGIVYQMCNMWMWCFSNIVLDPWKVAFLLHFCCYIFQSWKRSLLKLGRKFFVSLQKLFLVPRKSEYRILHIQISWCHQMPKHKTRNTCYWVT